MWMRDLTRGAMCIPTCLLWNRYNIITNMVLQIEEDSLAELYLFQKLINLEFENLRYQNLHKVSIFFSSAIGVFLTKSFLCFESLLLWNIKVIQPRARLGLGMSIDIKSIKWIRAFRTEINNAGTYRTMLTRRRTVKIVAKILVTLYVFCITFFDHGVFQLLYWIKHQVLRQDKYFHMLRGNFTAGW